MTRITFLGNFRESYCSESHHAKSLEALGHTVIRLQETRTSGHQVWKQASNSDLFIWVHTHGWKTPGLSMKKVLADLRRKGIKSLTYHLDLWFGLQRQEDMKHDDVWDIEHFFTVDKLMADWFNAQKAEGKGNTTGHYIQAGVLAEECYMAHTYGTDEKEIIFVGSKNYHREWNYRPALISWLQNEYKERFELWGGDGLGVVRGKALNELYAKTKIVVGDTLCINYDYPFYYSDRIFETIGRGGFIIHPYIRGIEEIFEDKKHCVFYRFGDFAQLRSLIDYYLDESNSEERESIRLAGHKHVKENHNYKVRWAKILSEI